ncbi:MAG: HEAT repeat domain-containing protein [Hyphomicrobiaceae bacterium]
MEKFRAKVLDNLMLWVALVAGFALIGIAVLIKSHDPYFEYRGFVLACGIATVFAGIGSTASIKYKAWSATGAAAIAIILFQVMKPDPAQDQYVRGQIEGTEKFLALYMRGSKPFLAGRIGKDAPFEYVAYRDELNSDTLVVTGELASVDVSRDITIGCIPIGLLKNALSSKRANFRLTFNKNGEIWQFWNNDGHYGEFGSSTCSSKAPKAATLVSPGSTHAGIMSALIPPAYAKQPSGVPRLVAALRSDNLSERSAAREALSRLKTSDEFKELAEAWDIKKSDYRTDLGVLFSWVNAIRTDRAVAPKILTSLDPEQIEYVVGLTGYPDKTIRINATEALSWFLQSTGWPGAPPSEQKTRELVTAIQKVFRSSEAVKELPAWRKFAASRTDELNPNNILYNTLYSLEDARCQINPVSLKELQKTVKDFEGIALTGGRLPQIAASAKTFTGLKACPTQ